MIIGLNGSMGVGKTTAANHIARISNKPVKIIKFAAPLYDMQEFIYRRIRAVYSRPENFVKDRTLLQWLGTDWGRRCISNTIWIDLWKVEADRALQEGFVVVCDDVRFNNEAQALRELGGVVLNISSAKSSVGSSVVTGLTNHASEQGIDRDLIHWFLENNSTEKSFEASLTKLLVEQESFEVAKEFK